MITLGMGVKLGLEKSQLKELGLAAIFHDLGKIFYDLRLLYKTNLTDEEKEIFLNKIKYEGMTINALGKLINYLNSVEEETFVKGQMVRFVNINEDTNFANDIYEEIAKGVYIYGYPRFN